QAIAKLDNCFLVEGYTDVIQLHQAGVENVVASSGTALTPDQIRLVNRLTKNITVLFDGDAAGLRASLRGIDLILEEGMNVKVCTFPDGEDADSFAKKSSYDELIAYLQDNAKDFIQFKASLLMDEAKNDPVKKAGLIRDIVNSISKIPDRIQQEVYIQECARIMDISEQVLISTLAQLVQKDIAEAGKKIKEEQKAKALQPVVEEMPTEQKIRPDDLSGIEYEIVKALQLYGDKDCEFKNVFTKYNEFGDEVNFTETQACKVYEWVYLNLQEDEVEFTHPTFSALYKQLIDIYLNKEIKQENFVNHLPSELQNVVSDIYMDDDRYLLSEWEDKQQIPVKLKDMTVEEHVTQIIFDLRSRLITKLIHELIAQITPDGDNSEAMQDIMDYTELNKNVLKRIERIRTT